MCFTYMCQLYYEMCVYSITQHYFMQLEEFLNWVSDINKKSISRFVIKLLNASETQRRFIKIVAVKQIVVHFFLVSSVVFDIRTHTPNFVTSYVRKQSRCLTHRLFTTPRHRVYNYNYFHSEDFGGGRKYCGHNIMMQY